MTNHYVSQNERSPVSLGSFRGLRAVQALFDQAVLNDLSYEFRKSFDQLRESGWEKRGGFSPVRLARRFRILEIAEGLPFLSRSGYRAAFNYYLASHSRRKRGPWRFVDQQRQKTVVLRHRNANDTLVILTGNIQPEGEVFNFHALSVFAPSSFSQSEEEIFDLGKHAPEFNGTGKHFFTPSGNSRHLDSHWEYSKAGAGVARIYGQVSYPGRDSHNRVIFARKFPREFLPSLDLPEHCAVYSIARSQIYA